MTVRLSVAVPVPPLLVALRATLNAPADAGVPEITPVPASTASPAGSPLAPKLVGLFVAVIVYEKAAPTVPLAPRELVMTGGG